MIFRMGDRDHSFLADFRCELTCLLEQLRPGGPGSADRFEFDFHRMALSKFTLSTSSSLQQRLQKVLVKNTEFEYHENRQIVVNLKGTEEHMTIE